MVFTFKLEVQEEKMGVQEEKHSFSIGLVFILGLFVFTHYTPTFYVLHPFAIAPHSLIAACFSQFSFYFQPFSFHSTDLCLHPHAFYSIFDPCFN